MRRWLPGFALLLLCALGATPARAADTIDLRPLAQALDTARCPLPAPAAIARLPDRCFIPFGAVAERPDDTLSNPPTFWYRVRLPAAAGDGRGWDVRLSFMVATGMLYVVSPSGAVTAVPLGMQIPVADRAVRTKDDRIPLPAATHPGDTLVLRITTTLAQWDPFELHTVDSLREMDDVDSRYYFGPLAFLNGMLMSMALYNLLLFAQLRKPWYLLYSLAMIAMIVFQTIQNGIAWTLFWPHLSVRDDYPAYLAYVVYFALVTAFSRSFLDVRRTSRSADTMLLVALAFLALDGVLYVEFPGLLAKLGLWHYVDPVAVAFMIVALLYAGIVSWIRGVVSARYYVIGFAGAAIGLFVAEAADYGLIVLPDWKDLLSAIGVAWEAVFLAFALAERIRFAEHEAARLSDYAYRDQLTGIPNRRAFDDALEREWRRGIRSARPLSLLIVDIDRFKAYNDRFGHQQGDVALRSVAAEIEISARRPGDFAARYGGEEFAIVLAETSREGAFASAEAVRLAIRARNIEHEGGPLTVSVGCATLVPNETDRPDMLIAFADSALYEAKDAGRDRTAAAAPDRRVLPRIEPAP